MTENDKTINKSYTSVDDDLLPCPFCGGAGYLMKDSYYDDPRYADPNCPVLFEVGCETCKVSFEEIEPLEKAISMWNRRANG